MNQKRTMNKYRIIRFLFLSLVLLVAGCASSGSNFRDDALSKLQPGHTTENEAATILGSPPTQKIHNANGTRLLVWSYATAAFGSVQSKAVSILFDGNGVMLGFNRGVNVALPVTPSNGRKLGIYVTSQLPNGGFTPIISSVQKGSVSETAGWKTGDIIIAVDNIPVTTLTEVVTETQKGSKSKTYTLKRGNKTVTSQIEFSF